MNTLAYMLYALIGLWAIFLIAVVYVVNQQIRFWDGHWSAPERTDESCHRNMKARQPALKGGQNEQ